MGRIEAILLELSVYSNYCRESPQTPRYIACIPGPIKRHPAPHLGRHTRPGGIPQKAARLGTMYYPPVAASFHLGEIFWRSGDDNENQMSRRRGGTMKSPMPTLAEELRLSPSINTKCDHFSLLQERAQSAACMYVHTHTHMYSTYIPTQVGPAIFLAAWLFSAPNHSACPVREETSLQPHHDRCGVHGCPVLAEESLGCHFGPLGAELGDETSCQLSFDITSQL
jgi:hypothetical protein